MEDETQYTVTVSDFSMSIYEPTQAEYQEIMGGTHPIFPGKSVNNAGRVSADNSDSLSGDVEERLKTNGIIE